MALTLALLAAAAPVTAAVHGLVSKNRDLELAERDYQFKTQSWFLQNAVDPEKTPELRQQVLRFISRVQAADATLVGWANDELKRVDEVVALRTQLALAQQSEQSAHDELEKHEDGAPDAKPRPALVEQVKKAQQESTRIQKQLADKDPAQFNVRYLQVQAAKQPANLVYVQPELKARLEPQTSAIGVR